MSSGDNPLLVGDEGDFDRIVDPSAVAEFSGGITSSQSVVFDACGHALPRDCPDALMERYLAFLTLKH